MTKRKLTPEEAALWEQVAARTERLHPETRGKAEPPKPKPKKKPQVHRPEIEPFDVGQSAARPPAPHDLKKPISDRVNGAALSMDRKAFTRMRRGKLVPEARIDLHGMTLERAHPALTRFILRAQSDGKRLVLVITGKGRTTPRDDDGPIPRPRGVLKNQVPDWLSRPPLAQAVLQVAEAHISHGGTGAYYVYLRRAR